MINRYVALFILCFIPFFGSVTYGQDLPSPAEETIKEPKKKPKRGRKFLSLALGVDHEEKLRRQIRNPKTKGDFRKVATVEYSSEAKALRITPKAEGIATLQIYDAKDPKQKILIEYRLEVRKSKLDSIAREIKGLLNDIEGINIKIVNNKVMVDGQVVIPKDMNRIYSVVQQYGEQAVSLVSVSPIAQKRLAEFIEKAIGNPEVTVKALNEKFILEGQVNSEDEKNKAEIIAKVYVQPIYLEPAEKDRVLMKQRAANDGIVNLIAIRPLAPPPPTRAIQLVVHYVELSKDYQKSFNFQFTPSLKDDSRATFSTQSGSSSTWSLSGIVDSLLPKLNWAKSHGYARILESTTLVVQDGKKGVLNSTQDVPFQTAVGTQGTPSTSFKEVGIATAITPVIINGDRSDQINLTMEFDISSLISVTPAGPLTSKNKISSELIVRSGQSAAVGGLIKNNTSTDFNRPGNAPANPIVRLMASKEFQRNQSQFVVFITPIIKANAADGSNKIKKKFQLRE